MKTLWSLSIFLLGLAFSLGTHAAAEVPPDESRDCFPGAYYRKAVSSVDKWIGIETVIRLPEPHYDMDRVNEDTGRPLDNASIYLGGRAGGQEVDAGVSWEVIREADGSVSKTRQAFRPFWRVTSWGNAPAEPEFYYQPGDVLRMTLKTEEKGKLAMEVEVLERTEKSKAMLERLGGDDEKTSFTVAFEAEPFGPGEQQEFKRVNGLDQSGNEGKPVQPTGTRIMGAEWKEAWLLRNGERLPFTQERYTDMRCPDPQHVAVEKTKNAEKGGEVVHLVGDPEG